MCWFRLAMSPKPKRRKCRCCSTFFFPDYRNWKHQHYCGKPECRRASKLASQQRWYRKPKNLSHFRNGEGTERVRTWRKAHPGYGCKKIPVAAVLNPLTHRQLNSPLGELGFHRCPECCRWRRAALSWRRGVCCMAATNAATIPARQPACPCVCVPLVVRVSPSIPRRQRVCAGSRRT